MTEEQHDHYEDGTEVELEPVDEEDDDLLDDDEDEDEVVETSSTDPR